MPSTLDELFQNAPADWIRQHAEKLRSDHQFFTRLHERQHHEERLATARELRAYEMETCGGCGCLFPAFQHKPEDAGCGVYVYPYCLKYCDECAPGSDFARKWAESAPHPAAQEIAFHAIRIASVKVVRPRYPLIITAIDGTETTINEKGEVTHDEET